MVKDTKPKGGTVSSSVARDGARGLAVRAISVLSARDGALARDHSNPQLQAICDAFVDPEEGPRHEAITALQTHGLRDQEIIDHIIPTTARLMGERWFANKLSFAEVTIGAARLQETIRGLNTRRGKSEIADGDRILLVVPLFYFVDKQITLYSSTSDKAS